MKFKAMTGVLGDIAFQPPKGKADPAFFRIDGRKVHLGVFGHSIEYSGALYSMEGLE
jgi:hypothetical protein